MKNMIFLALLGFMFCFAVAGAQQVYRWVDEKGTTHFTDDPSLIPEKHWNRIQKERMPVETASPPSGSPSPVPPPAVQTLRQPEKKPEGDTKKDVLGRGSEWWGAQVKTWQERLHSAQKNYEVADAAVKAKEIELRDSVFKPDSYKRRLNAELKSLQGKADELRKQVEEARTMLDETLPKQAEEYLADPLWLKVPEKK